MNALLLKDWFLLRRQSKVTALMILLFTFIGVSSSSVFYVVVGSIVGVMIPLTTIAWDQMHHWDQFVIALPVERKDVVKGKYVLALLSLTVSVLLVVVVGLVFLATGRLAADVFSLMIWAQVIAGLFFISVNYPIVIKLGFERGRIWYIIITIPIMALVGFLSSTLNLDVRMVEVTSRSFIFLVVPVILLYISYRLSVSFLEQKAY